MRYLMCLALFLSASVNQVVLASPALQVINPASLVAAGNGTRWEAGVLLGQIDTSFNRATAAGVAPAGRYNAASTHPALPFFALSYVYNEQLTLGFAIDTPYYLDIRWPDHTFDVSAGGEALDLIKRGKLVATRAGPAAAIRLNERWSGGMRLFMQHVEAMEESDFAKAEGDGNTFGVQVGLRYASASRIVGVAFTTRTNTEVHGSQTNIHPVAAGALIPGDAKADILLPPRLHTSVAFALQPTLWGELELEWLGGSYVDERTIYQADGTISNRGKNLRHYRDTVNTRVGIKWQRTPKLALYGTVGYEPTPVPEQDIAPVQSFLNRTRLTIGSSLKLRGDWRLDTAYQYAHGHSRTVNATDQDSLAGSDTHVYEGTYRSRSHALRLSVTGTF